MKTLYSSSFITAVFAFLILLGQSGGQVTVVQDAPRVAFQTIIEPIGPTPPASDGRVKVEVFNSFGCQECDNFGLGTLPALQQKYAENEAVDFHLYLISAPESDEELFAIRGAHCAAEHERFWDMVYELHRAESLSQREVDLTGQSLNLPVVAFRNCIKSNEFDEQMGQDINYAQEKGVRQKPTIMVNGTMMLGAQPLENIEREINQYLKK
jgi:protein-disulfide isomerase